MTRHPHHLFLLAFLASPAFAQPITPISQDRRLLAHSFDYNSPIPGSDSQEAIAPDFTLFDRTITSHYYQGNGGAAQYSEILPQLLYGNGSASGGGNAFDNGGGGTSRFDVTFSVAQPTSFTLSGQLIANSFFPLGTATARVTLDNVDLAFVSGYLTLPLSSNGNLTAGSHHLRVEAIAASPPGPGFVTASFNFHFALAPPHIPADLNCDSIVNDFDIDPFVLALTDPAAYSAAFPNCNINNADVNADGAVNNFDIDPFVACLTAGGCP